MGDAAGQEDVDDRLSRCFLLGSALRAIGLGVLDAEELIEGQTEAAEDAGLKEAAPAATAKVSGVVLPTDGLAHRHVLLGGTLPSVGGVVGRVVHAWRR